MKFALVNGHLLLSAEKICLRRSDHAWTNVRNVQTSASRDLKCVSKEGPLSAKPLTRSHVRKEGDCRLSASVSLSRQASQGGGPSASGWLADRSGLGCGIVHDT